MAEILQLVMSKKPFGITKRIPEDVLKSENGVKEILKKLDEHYIPDKLQHTMKVWDKFMSIKRKHNEPMNDHIQRFMEVFENFQDIDSRLACPDTIVTMLLLTSCNLNEDDSKIVKAQMEEPPASKNLIGILKRVMTTDKTNKETDEETEIFFSNTQLDNSSSDRATRTTLYAQDNRRVYRPVRRGRAERTDPSWRPDGPSWRPEGRAERTDPSWRADGPSWRPDGPSWRPDGPKKNPRGPDGDYQRCHFCDSIWHYVNGCPDVKKFKREYRNKKDDRDDKDFDRDVHLSI